MPQASPLSTAAIHAATVGLIEQELACPELGAAFIAASLGISVRRLQRTIASEAGSTVRNLVFEARMQRAYEFMIHQSLPARATAPVVGYRSASYLARRFGARFGAPPHVLRDRYQAIQKRS